MARAKDWAKGERPQSLLEWGGKTVTVSRADDQNRNVGVQTELEEDQVTFTITARIDALSDRENPQAHIAEVEPHILPMMRKGDIWTTYEPQRELRYKVTRIQGEDIFLDAL